MQSSHTIRRRQSLLRPACRRRQPRRGVLLLVILSLLVLFAVIAVTFALVSSQFRRSSQYQPRLDQYAVDYRDQLDDAAYQVFRGTNNASSVISIHSLLEDFYGLDGFTSVSQGVSIISSTATQNVTPQVVGQLIDVQLSASLPAPPVLASSLYPSGKAPAGYYNGCVLTMTSGALAGKSTRIVGYDTGTGPATSGTPTLRVMAFEGTAAGVLPQANQTFVINGRPFNGTGFGLDLTTNGFANSKDGNGHLFALQPNPKYYTASANYTRPDGFGGADEDYDAADWNNMALGLTASPPLSAFAGLPYPSFHRPELVDYWTKKLTATSWKDITTSNYQAQLRKVMLRPVGGFAGSDHPYFTGSNTNFDPTIGPWDVDTDGDGINDSVWLDLGFPVQTAADGTTFKPLFAIRVLDMDGRLNVNAHGNSAQVEAAYGQTVPGYFANNTSSTTAFPVTPNTLTNSAGTPISLGSGYGTSEISLLPLYLQEGNGAAQYASLFAGITAGTLQIEGRYGEFPYSANGSYTAVQPSSSTPPYAGNTNSSGNEITASALGAIKHFEFPISGSPAPTAYGSAPDLWGRGFVGLDIQGTPLTTNMAGAYDVLNNPYDLNLSRTTVRGSLQHGAVDNPFTAAELERLLRVYDLDSSSLPPRLAQLLDPSTINNPPFGSWIAALRKQVTTDTWDPPSPSVMATSNTRNAGYPLVYSPVDLLTSRLPASIVTNPATLQAQLLLMLPPEVMAGQRFDLNRPFGNGLDDNLDGVVDDYSEYAYTPMGAPGPEPAWAGVFPPGGTAVSLAIDYNGDGSINALDALYARQQMARYLYVMAMMVVDPALINANQSTAIVYDAGNAGPTVVPSANQYQVQFALAQWAINCVDFRDRDSIMTPFEFDVNPFNGWQPDGDITTSGDTDTAAGFQTVVWGAERPELLISETIGWHDRRTEDLGDDTTPVFAGNKTTGAMTPDADFDQRLLPQSVCFVELYNPWNTQYSTLNGNNPSPAEVPGELYYDANNANYHAYSGANPNVPAGVILNKRDPSSTSPVWRMIFVANKSGSTPDPRTLDPDDPIPANRPNFGSGDVERTVYFANPNGGSQSRDGSLTYYTSQAVAPLLPGRYAVVGSATQQVSSTIAGVTPASATNLYMSKVGRTTSATDTAPQSTQTRRVVLAPDVSPANNQVWVMNSGQTGDPTPISGVGTSIQPAIAIAVDTAINNVTMAGPTPRSFGVSDPVNGYTPGVPLSPPTPTENELVYATPLDKPQDGVVGDSQMLTNKTYVNYRTVHLQRLANPQLPWNAQSNPYLTIDSASVDVTAFNGVNNINNLHGTAKANDSLNPPGNAYKLVSTQRGDQYTANKPANMYQTNLLWAHEFARPAAAAVAVDDPSGTHIYSYALHHTLGYLNQGYGSAGVNNNFLTQATPPPLPTYTGALNTGAGVPPFPWLTWNNRPFASPLELAMVPKSRQSRLLFDYGVSAAAGTSLFTATSGSQVLYPTTAGSATTPASGMAPPQLFGHLLNFYDAGVAGAGPPFLDPNNSPSANLYRLFEYVQVPTKYVGTETVLNPTKFAAATMNESAFWSFLRPPFNRVSEYRDPGRVNINTLIDPYVAAGVLNGTGTTNATPPALTTVADFVQSRQGFATVPPAGTPSFFLNPFRSFAGAALTNSVYTDASVGVLGQALRDIDVTVLRPSSTNAATALFDYPNITATAAPPYADYTRSQYHRIQNASRMMNLLTTRSNVYAVWVTVGYFQVTAAPATAPDGTAAKIVYPDGYQLGPELGNETGEVKRHRSFYLFDRTIPVGFQRGENYNVDNAILLRRFIE